MERPPTPGTVVVDAPVRGAPDDRQYWVLVSSVGTLATLVIFRVHGPYYAAWGWGEGIAGGVPLCLVPTPLGACPPTDGPPVL